jgi:hypothetical protein
MKRQKEDDDRFLNRVDGHFVFNHSHHLYLPNRLEGEERPNSADRLGANRSSRLFVEVARDWVVILISASTLMLLVLTVVYARHQWRTMNATLDEIRKQSGSAERTAVASQNMAKAAQEANESTQRMLEARFIMTLQPRSDKGVLNVVFRNVGKAEARDVFASGEATTQSIIDDNSHPQTEKENWQLGNVLPEGSPERGIGFHVPKAQAGSVPETALPIQLSAKVIYVKLRISYDSGFGKKAEQTFCLAVVADSNVNKNQLYAETPTCAESASYIATRRQQLEADQIGK